MDIAFRNRGLARTFNSERALQKTHGARMARAIMNRLAVLRAAANLALVPVTPPERCHRLRGARDGQFAVDLVQPYRLEFAADHDPLPRTGMAGSTWRG